MGPNTTPPTPGTSTGTPASQPTGTPPVEVPRPPNEPSWTDPRANPTPSPQNPSTIPSGQRGSGEVGGETEE